MCKNKFQVNLPTLLSGTAQVKQAYIGGVLGPLKGPRKCGLFDALTYILSAGLVF